MERWEGTTAVVTGASSGIGAAISKILVEKGMKVVGIARRIDKIQELANSLIDAPGQLFGLKCDITNEESILKCFKWITDNVGVVNVLINNAGIMKSSNLTDGSTEDWKRVFDINVMALCICTREAIRIMKENNISGHIIHMNSILGHCVPNLKSKPSFNVYPASKFAVTALTDTLRQELRSSRSGIKITSISPGSVKNDNSTPENSVNSNRLESSNQSTALKPEDIAEAVLYVLSTGPHVQVQDVIIHALGEVY